MRSSIDSAGRVVIPKAIRERLGLRGGTAIEIDERDGRVDISIVGPRVFVDQSGPRPVLRIDGDIPPMTDAEVRTLVETTRR